MVWRVYLRNWRLDRGALANAGSKTLHVVATVNTDPDGVKHGRKLLLLLLSIQLQRTNKASITITFSAVSRSGSGMTVSSPTVLSALP